MRLFFFLSFFIFIIGLQKENWRALHTMNRRRMCEEMYTAHTLARNYYDVHLIRAVPTSRLHGTGNMSLGNNNDIRTYTFKRVRITPRQVSADAFINETQC